MKRLFSIGLLLALSMQFMGYQLLFPVAQRTMRIEAMERIEAGIPESELVKFTYNINSEEFKTIDWKEEHEFRLNKQMYDVVEIRINGDNISMLCYHDKDESELWQYLETLVEANLDRLGHSAKKVLDFIKTTVLFHIQETLTPFVAPARLLNPLFKSLAQGQILPAHLEIVDLPPEV